MAIMLNSDYVKYQHYALDIFTLDNSYCMLYYRRISTTVLWLWFELW